MSFNVQFVGPVKDLVEKVVVEYYLPTPITVQELIDFLISRYGTKFEQEIYTKVPPDNVFFYQILINGSNIYRFKGLQTEINTGDKVLISIPLAGG